MAAPFKSVGWDMYDPRLTIKATVHADCEDIELGYACRIDSNGYIDSDLSAHGNRVHGCALTNAKAGDELVLVTHGRLKVVDAQAAIGDLVYGQAEANGSSPNADTETGNECGIAIAEYMLFIHCDNLSGTEA